MHYLNEIVALSAGRWLVPLLALAGERDGFRMAEAVGQLGIARGVARDSVDRLVAGGWLARNPGHGHPLRPEYLPTDRGRAAAAWCSQVMLARAELDLAPADLTRWTLPTVAVLTAGEARFGHLSARLAPVSPRALTLTLKAGLVRGLLSRRLEDAYPPVPFYWLADGGHRLAAGLAAG